MDNSDETWPSWPGYSSGIQQCYKILLGMAIIRKLLQKKWNIPIEKIWRKVLDYHNYYERLHLPLAQDDHIIWGTNTKVSMEKICWSIIFSHSYSSKQQIGLQDNELYYSILENFKTMFVCVNFYTKPLATSWYLALCLKYENFSIVH